MQHNHIDLIDCGIVPDNKDALADAYEQALQGADVVISSGGASDGIEDHTQNAMLQIGAECVFWRLAMKPGRPMAVGRRGKRAYFLPSGQSGCRLCLHKIVNLTVIRACCGGAWQPALKIGVPAGFTHRKKPGRAEFLRVVLENNGGKQRLCCMEGKEQGSFLL